MSEYENEQILTPGAAPAEAAAEGPGAASAPDLRTARKSFSRMGFALLVFLAATALLQGGATVALQLWTGAPSWAFWVLGYILPVYGVGVPLCLLVLRKLPRDTGEPRPLGGKNFFVMLLMCFPIMYGGNLIGTILSGILSGGAAQNPLESMVSSPSLLSALVLAVMAPLFEEYVFRKCLIDRARRYGEKTAILFSGLTFALFHMNLYQFFYAFGLGLLFAYIYTRTRRLRYTVCLHMIINFIGSVLAPWLVTQFDPEALGAVAGGDVEAAMALVQSPGYLLFMLYAVALLALSIAGLVLLIKRRKSFVIEPAPEELPKQLRFKTVYLTAGVILFALACLAGMVAMLVI